MTNVALRAFDTVRKEYFDEHASRLWALADKNILRSVLEEGYVSDVSRERVPAERPGMLFYDGSDEYWTRSVRTVYEEDIRYEWDTEGRTLRYDVGPSRDGDSESISIPNRIRAEFDNGLETIAEPTKSVQPDVDDETVRRLEDLGYKL